MVVGSRLPEEPIDPTFSLLSLHGHLLASLSTSVLYDHSWSISAGGSVQFTKATASETVLLAEAGAHCRPSDFARLGCQCHKQPYLNLRRLLEYNNGIPRPV
jgi:hypothetical protein